MTPSEVLDMKSQHLFILVLDLTCFDSSSTKMDVDLVSNVIKFNSQTNGRDKLCRLFQYGCRLAYGQYGKNLELTQKLKAVESTLSMTRKLLRFGKSLDFLQGALKSIHLQDAILRLTITLSKINQALYLLFDHFLWFNNIGVVKLNKQYWSEVSSKFYLATLLLNLIRDIYGFYDLILLELQKYRSTQGKSIYRNGDAKHKEMGRRSRTFLDVFLENKPLFLDFFKNFFDLAIPLSTLDKVKISPRTQGLLGVISSGIAVATVWNPRLKLTPS